MLRMAKETVVTEVLTDDLDGSTADRTVRFSWDGATYEIELSKKNASALEKAVAPYVAASRKVAGANGRRRRTAAPAPRPAVTSDLATVRAWARDNGYTVSDRGRISSAVIDAYRAAH